MSKKVLPTPTSDFRKKRKQVGVVATDEKDQLKIVICACSARGHFVPPYFIVEHRKKLMNAF